MDITPLIPEGRQVINKYGNGSFTINDRTYSEAVLVFPEETLPMKTDTLEEITEKVLKPLIEKKAELVIVGTGEKQQWLSTEARDYLRTHKIAVECMATGPACRTYNVLLTEGRAVAAALIPV